MEPIIGRFVHRGLAARTLAAATAGCLVALAEAWNGTHWTVTKTPHP